MRMSKVDMWVVIAALAIGVLVLIPDLQLRGVGTGDIVVKVVDEDNNALGGSIVYIIGRDRGNPYDIAQKMSGYDRKGTTGEDGVYNFGGGFYTNESYTIGVVCPAAYNYRTYFGEYNPLSGSIVGYSKIFTCKSAPRSALQGNESVPQEYSSEPQVDGVGSVCFQDIYIDESCSDFNWGDKYYFFNQDIVNAKGKKMKQCWTQPLYVWGTCLQSQAEESGELCVAAPKYLVQTGCRSGFTEDGGDCCRPLSTAVDEYPCDGVLEDREGQKVCVHAITDVCDGTWETVDGVRSCVKHFDVQIIRDETIFTNFISKLSDQDAMIVAGGVALVVAMILFKKRRK